MIEQLILGDIAIKITRKKIKNLHLKIIPPDGLVCISAPLRLSLSQIQAFALSKIDWIKKYRIKLQQQSKAAPNQYLDNETHLVWGQRYLLKLLETNGKAKVEIHDQQLYLHMPTGASEQKREAIIENWYRDQLKQAIPPLIAKWEPQMDVKVTQFFIQRMKTRWGSCSPHSKRIRFNTELAKKSPICLEYVVVHEMVHLLEASHNHRFKALMTQFLPDWRIHRSQLNQYVFG